MTANRSGDGDTMLRNAIFMFGGQITDKTGQIVVLNTEPFRTNSILGLNFIKDIYTNPQWAAMLPPGVAGWTDTSNNEAWLGGKIGMTSNAGTVFAKAVVDKNPVADDTFLILQPKGLGPAARSLSGAGGAMCFYFMKGGKNREAGEQLVRYLMSPEIQKQMFKISTGYVIRLAIGAGPNPRSPRARTPSTSRTSGRRSPTTPAVTSAAPTQLDHHHRSVPWTTRTS